MTPSRPGNTISGGGETPSAPPLFLLAGLAHNPGVHWTLPSWQSREHSGDSLEIEVDSDHEKVTEVGKSFF